MAASTLRVKKTLARSLQHKTQTSLDTDRSRPTREGASRRPYAEAHAQVRPTALPAFLQSCWLFERKSSSHRLLQSQSLGKAQKAVERQRRAGRVSAAVSPAHNCILHAQIRYVLRDKPLALGSRVLSRIRTYCP